MQHIAILGNLVKLLAPLEPIYGRIAMNCDSLLCFAIFYDGKICIVGLSAPNTGFLLAYSCSTIAFGFFNFGLNWGQICLQE